MQVILKEISKGVFLSLIFLTLCSTISAQIQQINSWYGQDNKANMDTTAKLNSVLSTYGFIAIPGNMNTFFGRDPLPGVRKTVAIALTLNGARVSPDLRAAEGLDFIYPINTSLNLARNALSKLKGTSIPNPSIQIISATYGKNKLVDVTVPLQILIDQLPADTKVVSFGEVGSGATIQIPQVSTARGAWQIALAQKDPEPGVVKTLTVRFSISGLSEQTATCTDRETLKIERPAWMDYVGGGL